MEMEYKDGSRRGRIILLLGVVLAVFAGIAAYALLSQKSTTSPENLPTVNVVVAAHDLVAGVPLTANDVIVKVVPSDAVVAGALVDPAQAVGQVLAVPAVTGQPLYPSMIVTAVGGGGFTILGPLETVGPDSQTWRAISITIPDDRAVGGILAAGMRIDIIVTATINLSDPAAFATFGPYVTGPSTKLVYQNVKILARVGSSYIIRTDVPTAEEIDHLMATGAVSFSAALRPDQDVRWVDATKLGTTTYVILKKYGMPLPQNWPLASPPIPTSPPIVYPTEPPPPATPGASESPAASVGP